MKAVHFDAKIGKEMPAHEARGVAGFISWRRLAELFRTSGEVRASEDLLSFQVDDRGISFRVEIK